MMNFSSDVEGKLMKKFNSSNVSFIYKVYHAVFIKVRFYFFKRIFQPIIDAAKKGYIKKAVNEIRRVTGHNDVSDQEDEADEIERDVESLDKVGTSDVNKECDEVAPKVTNLILENHLLYIQNDMLKFKEVDLAHNNRELKVKTAFKVFYDNLFSGILIFRKIA